MNDKKPNEFIFTDIEEGQQFPVLMIIEKLANNKLIDWKVYHAFITDERSYGPIYGIIQDGKFEYIGMEYSDFGKVRDDFELAFFTIYNFINNRLKERCN